MKKQVQQTGVRKWFGDDFVSIQDELFEVLDSFFGSYGQQFILSGCIVNGNDISAGIVGLIDGEGFHLCSFSGVQGTAWPVYFYPSKVTENRAYLDNQVKPVSESWTVATSGNNPGGYLQFKQDGTSARFFDAIQTVNRRFVTDAEKATYNGQAASAINTVRGGVAAGYDTLAKIVTTMLLLAAKDSPALTGTPTAPTPGAATNTAQIATTAFVQDVVAALVASSPAALDTLNELAAALGNDPNFATTITNALATKEPKNANIQSHISSSLNPHAVTKSQVGLGSVDNTSDVNKPVSSAQQTALNLKANLASPALTGTPTTPTAATATNNTQVANTAFVKAVIASLGLETLITANSPALTGIPTAPTAAAGTNTTQIATTAFIQAAISALVASSPAALDTLNELAAALGNDANFATTMTNALAGKLNTTFSNISNVITALTALNVEGTEALSGTAVDWATKPVKTKTLTGNTTLSFLNMITNKTITLIVTGNFSLALPAGLNTISGEYDGSKSNLIQLFCANSATSEVWCTISQKQ